MPRSSAPDRLATGVAQQEDSVGSGIGVEVASVGQRLDHSKGQGALRDEVSVGRRGTGAARAGANAGGGRPGRERSGSGWCGVLFEPMQGVAKGELVQMNDQVDGATPADAVVPVEELGAAHRKDAAGGVPFARVVAIGPGAGLGQDVFQRDRRVSDRPAPAGRVSCRFGGAFGAQAGAVVQVEDVAVLGQAIDEGGGQRGVLEEGIPVGKAEVGGDEGGLFLVALLQEGEEEADLGGFDLARSPVRRSGGRRRTGSV